MHFESFGNVLRRLRDKNQALMQDRMNFSCTGMKQDRFRPDIRWIVKPDQRTGTVFTTFEMSADTAMG